MESIGWGEESIWESSEAEEARPRWKSAHEQKKLQNHHETSTHVLDFIHTIESFVSSEAPKKTTV